MCGITGLLSRGPARHDDAVVRARDLLAHRGPESAGLWTGLDADESARITLGHRRLCILDVSERSAQPMLLTSEGRVRPSLDDTVTESDLAMVFNGEIYNFVELRAELGALGHRFTTTGDAEVLLLAYAEWGADCLTRLNGMFAFAIWDARRNELFCARDRFGEKPFHYVLDESRGVFAFASEIKALIAMGAADAELDVRAVYRYFRFGEQAGVESTIWTNVKRLPPAHAATVRVRGGSLHMRTWRWWRLPERGRKAGDAETIAEFRNLFADSVGLRLRSDVPVGSSLSGGLDSSSVVSQVALLGAAGGQLAFTAAMEDPAFDESRHARLVAQRVGVTSHSVTPTAAALVEQFDRLFFHQEEPFPSTSIFASWLVQQLAHEHGVTVLLDGQGADEYLAGYAHYPAAALVDLARRGHVTRWWRERRALRERTGEDPIPFRAALWHWQNALRTHDDTVAVDAVQPVPFLLEDIIVAHRCETPRRVPSVEGLLATRLRADLTEGHLQELLRYADRNAMAFGRETRLPFLDHRLVELVMARPLPLSYRDGESKWILRRAMRGIVPDEILNRRDKIGFATPWATWTAGQHRGALSERLRQAERDLEEFVLPGSLLLNSSAALGVMSIASTRAQFRCLTPSQLAGR